MDKLRTWWVVGALGFFCWVGGSARGGELDDRLARILDEPRYKQSRWGLCVVDARSGKTLFEHNADQLFCPASVTKLFTCAAALTALGPEFRFETPVYSRGRLERGKLLGDLILVGKGDPVLGGRQLAKDRLEFRNRDHTHSNPATPTQMTKADPLAGLNDLAKQIRRAGIDEVAGDVLVDDRLFETLRGDQFGQLVVSPVAVNDNVVDVLVTPAEKAGDLATVEPRPKTDYLRIDARVRTVEVDPDDEAAIRVYPRGDGRFVIRGEIGANSAPRLVVCRIEEPTAFARALFIEALRRAGITVEASVLRQPKRALPSLDAYPKWQAVAVHRSAPLRELVRVTMKVSHNLYANTMPMLLAAREGKRDLRSGMRAQGRLLKQLGLSVEGMSLQTGAGGGKGDKLSPRHVIELMQKMAQQRTWSVYSGGFPTMGVDGTLAESVSDSSPLRSKVWAKTGMNAYDDPLNGRALLASKTLAGMMRTRSGRSLYFAIFLNDFPLGENRTPTDEGTTILQMCEYFWEFIR